MNKLQKTVIKRTDGQAWGSIEQFRADIMGLGPKFAELGAFVQQSLEQDKCGGDYELRENNTEAHCERVWEAEAFAQYTAMHNEMDVDAMLAAQGFSHVQTVEDTEVSPTDLDGADAEDLPLGDE